MFGRLVDRGLTVAVCDEEFGHGRREVGVADLLLRRLGTWDEHAAWKQAYSRSPTRSCLRRLLLSGYRGLIGDVQGIVRLPGSPAGSVRSLVTHYAAVMSSRSCGHAVPRSDAGWPPTRIGYCRSAASQGMRVISVPSCFRTSAPSGAN